MKKILILNGSHSEIPLIKAALSYNLKIYITGTNKDAIGNKYGNDYIELDYSDKEKILALSKKINIDYICAPAHDLGLLTATYVANRLSLPGYDNINTSKKIIYKDEFKKFSNQIKFKTVKEYSNYFSFNDLPVLNIKNKFILKPIDSGGGRGISLISNNKELLSAKQKALKVSKSKKFIIEDYIEGSLHSLNTYIFNNIIIFYYHDDEFCLNNQFGVSTSSSPSTLKKANLKSALLDLEYFSKMLNLKNGILHSQILQNNTGYYFVELTRRCSGDLYSLPVKFSTNIDLADVFIRNYIDKTINKNYFLNSKKQTSFISRHCLMAHKNGKIDYVFISPKIKDNVIYELSFAKKGSLITNWKFEKFGVFVLKFKSETEMKNKIKSINDMIYIKVI